LLVVRLASNRNAGCQISAADACVGGLICIHRARDWMRVGTIQVGVADLPSPKSIQPDSRVKTIGAPSECFWAERAKLRVMFCIEVVAEFVMALILSLSSRQIQSC
jgi:hypothetical protein